MTPLSATLTGSLGIRAGLNRDSVTLDLTTIPEDATVVAIKGDNGMGKSTILNLALSPYREPPQIAGTIYDQFGEAGSRDLVWTHEGRTYRTQIAYRKRTQRATLHVLEGEEWTPVTLPDHTSSDGKASTYDACVEHILGPREIYYLSAFRAQNAPKLAEHGDPKSLMRALLDLDQPADLSEKARQVARELTRAHHALRAQTAALDGHEERIQACNDQVSIISAGHQLRVEAKLAAIEASARAKAELERALAGDIDRQRLIDQRNAAQTRLVEAQREGERSMQAARDVRKAAESRLAKARVDAEAHANATSQDIASARARLARAEAKLAERAAIEAATAEAQQIAERIAEAERTETSLDREIAALRDLDGQVKALEVARKGLESDGRTIAARVAELNARAGFVAIVPCRGEGEYAACPALQEALQAKSQAAEAEAQAQAKREEWGALSARLRDISAKVAPLPEKASAYAAARADLESLRIRLRAVQATAAQASALELAQQQHDEAMEQITALTARLESDSAKAASQITQIELECAAWAADESKAAEQAQALVQAAAAEFAAIPDPGTDEVVFAAREAVAQREAELAAATRSIEAASAEKAAHQAEAARLRGELDAGASVLAKARALEAEIADWTLLAMGLRGVIDLSIEDAGPGIAALANQLLADAYGPGFTVRIVTQREQANGVVRECFDISVLDAETGIESSIIQKSGGESVWLDKALTDAVGLYHQESSGRRFETLFADEADDGLTEERKRQFYQMDRAALAMGGFTRKYVVSHYPGAWDNADHVIDLADLRKAA